MNLAAFASVTRPDRTGEGAGEIVGDDEIVAALRDLAFSESDKPRVVALASNLLAGTRSNKVRNAAAIFLADQIGAEARDHILPLLRRPDLARSSGSLLFAMNEVGATLPLDVILWMVEHGSLEARAEALTFLEEERVDPFTPEEGDAARVRLAALHRQTVDATLSEAAGLAREYLDDLRPESTPSP